MQLKALKQAHNLNKKILKTFNQVCYPDNLKNNTNQNCM